MSSTLKRISEGYVQFSHCDHVPSTLEASQDAVLFRSGVHMKELLALILVFALLRD